MNTTVTCCFCRKEVPTIEANNPYPIATDPEARCCSECNQAYIIPERMKRARAATQETEYRYGMRLRGFSPGAQPMDNFKKRENDQTGNYYDVLVYTKPLPEEKTETYSLDFLGAAEPAPWI